jgi:sirohydrochlorin ferrochelatase
MDKGRIQELIESMNPLEAAEEMADAAKTLFSLLGEDALRDFLTNLIGEGGQDKITGLVHL